MVPGTLLIALMLTSYAQEGGQDLAEGNKALEANQPAAAEPFFRRAVAADPRDLQAQFSLALTLGLENKDTEAVAAYRRALEIKPGLYEADLNLGIILLRDRQPADAAPVLKEAAEQKPREYNARIHYAQALFDSGNAEEAEPQFRAALDIDAKSALANLGIARSLLKENHLAESEPYYRAAAALNGTYRNALLELGSEYDRIGDSTAAMAIYRQFPDNETVAKRLTALELATHNAAAAIPRLEVAVKNAPSTANRMALIDAYRDTGASEKALEQLRLAVAADASSYTLRMAYGRELRDRHQMADAAREFQAAAKLQPESTEVWNELAGALILLGQYDDGLAALDHLKAMNKQIPGDLYLRAITLDKLHRNQPALDAYREFLSASAGKFPDQEFLARQRSRIIEQEMRK